MRVTKMRVEAFRLLPGQRVNPLAQRQKWDTFIIKVTGLPCEVGNKLTSSHLRHFKDLGLGPAQNGERISFPIHLSAAEFAESLRTLLPGLGNVQYDICFCSGSTLLTPVPLEANTPALLKRLWGRKKSALYVRLVEPQALQPPLQQALPQQQQLPQQPQPPQQQQLPQQPQPPQQQQLPQQPQPPQQQQLPQQPQPPQQQQLPQQPQPPQQQQLPQQPQPPQQQQLPQQPQPPQQQQLPQQPQPPQQQQLPQQPQPPQQQQLPQQPQPPQQQQLPQQPQPPQQQQLPQQPQPPQQQQLPQQPQPPQQQQLPQQPQPPQQQQLPQQPQPPQQQQLPQQPQPPQQQQLPQQPQPPQQQQLPQQPQPPQQQQLPQQPQPPQQQQLLQQPQPPQQQQLPQQPQPPQQQQLPQQQERPEPHEHLVEEIIHLPVVNGPRRNRRHFVYQDMGTPTVQGGFVQSDAGDYDSADEFVPTVQRRGPDIAVNNEETAVALRARQDQEVARSLQIDRERESAERERRHTLAVMRQEREEGLRTQRERVGIEPADGPGIVKVVFRLPSGERQERNFHAGSSVKVLFDYIEGVQMVRNAKLVPVMAPALDRHSNALIGSIGLLINVQDQSDETESEPDEEPGSEELPGHNQQLTGVSAFKYKILEHRDNLRDRKLLKISRDRVVEDMLRAYKCDLDLPHHQLELTFEGEDSVDLGGPLKEGFRLFWDALCASHCEGRLQKVPKMDHRFLGHGLWQTAGRILAHGLVTTGYWPWQLNLASLCSAVSGTGDLVSTQLCVQSLKDFVTEDQALTISKLVDKSKFCDVSAEQRINLLQHLDAKSDISCDNASDVVESLARYALVWKPHAPLTQLSAGFRIYPVLWVGVREEMLVAFREDMIPTADRIVSALKFQFTDQARDQEERVSQYLEHFVQTSGMDMLRRFLVFCSASDLLNPTDELKVEFNSTSDFQRRPTAMTCSSTLTLSRWYVGEEDLRDDMVAVLREDVPFDSD